MRDIFLEKSYTKCGRETIPGPFSKNKNGAYTWIDSLKCYKCVLFYVQIDVHKYILKLRCLTLSFVLYKAF